MGDLFYVVGKGTRNPGEASIFNEERGLKVCIVDDVLSTGTSLLGLESLVEKAGGIVNKKIFVLAEGDAAKRDDVQFLATIPLF